MRQLPTHDRRYFSDDARRQVEVLFEAILPGGETSPGARDAGAADFLDAALAGPDYYEVAEWRRLYDAALPALDAAARERFEGPLAELEPQQAAELLGALQAGELTAMPGEIDQRRLFTTLRGHCVEGCFADPRWHGNRDAVVWRWIGYLEPARDFARGDDGELREVDDAER
jgi:gluconate 2-dehydrogenase gamma chain